MLVLDVILTALIFILWGDIIKYVQETIRLGFFGWDYEIKFFTVELFWKDVMRFLFDYPGRPESNSRSLDHFTLYTTFFTSVWVWLYALSTLGVVVGEKFGGFTWHRFKRFVDLSEKPFSSLGYIACVGVIFLSMVVGALYFGGTWAFGLVGAA